MGLFTTKTFWIGLVTVIGGVSTMLTGDTVMDFSSIGAAIDTIQALATTDGWQAVMLGLAIVTGRHAVSKLGN